MRNHIKSIAIVIYQLEADTLLAFRTSHKMSTHDDYSLNGGDDYDMGPEMWNDDQYASSESSITASVSNRRFKSVPIVDKGYFSVKYAIRKHRFRLEGYSSGKIPGAVIRNAVTGIYESDYLNNRSHMVGTRSEDLFFKVTLAISHVGSEPKTLFYDSIDQYERHFNTTVKDDVAQRWREKNQFARAKYEGESSKQEIEYVQVH
jgi:hypothetical protein